jgi:hypothetical protein
VHCGYGGGTSRTGRPGPGASAAALLRDQEGAPALPAEQASQGSQHGPVGRAVARTCNLASQHGQLVAQHGDLDVFLVG